MRNMHKYEELFPDEFEAELKRSPVIYCSFAPVEYHGPHGTLGMDTLKGYEMCLRAAAISGGIVFPDYEEISKVTVEFEERLIQTAAERIANEALQALRR